MKRGHPLLHVLEETGEYPGKTCGRRGKKHMCNYINTMHANNIHATTAIFLAPRLNV
jgi:hypothetical protein